MITCHRSHLEARCTERGYTLDEVMPCVIAQDGDMWTVDVDSPFYPRYPKPGYSPPGVPPTPPVGPGSELKRLLAGWPFRITASPDCSCNARAAEMDRQGCEWVEANLGTVVGWLRDEATKRGLPFVDLAGRMLVKQAIKRARKATLE